jgi:uncharacterized membrane protein
MVAGEAQSVLHGHVGWMAWNMVLAAVPMLLAMLLFRPGIRRRPLWWFGVVAFVLFLPNAPYVLTDVIHLFDDIRVVHSDLKILGIVLPLYLAFFTVGFLCYVLAMRCLRSYLISDAVRVPRWPLMFGLHALCAVGVYLGRVMRFNSWDAVTSPAEVASTADALNDVFPLVIIGCTFVVLVVGSIVTNLMIDATDRRVRPWLRRGRLAVQRLRAA